MRKKKIKPHANTQLIRAGIMKQAKRKGYITNEQARTIGGRTQAWYHLTALVKEGRLKHDRFNQWTLR